MWVVLALALTLPFHIGRRGAFGTAVLISLAIFSLLWLASWLPIRKGGSVYFDAQDFAHYEQGQLRRELPVSAATGTFEPLLEHYIGVTKLLVTIAAASITFGGTDGKSLGILFAKVLLACSILFGVLFCALLLFRYDEYKQNVRSYTKWWSSTVQALGFSCLALFVLGYGVWAIQL
jgi:hypothetical protein